MAFDSQGLLFVADRGNNRIQIFDGQYQFVDEWAQFGRPNDVFIDDDDTIVRARLGIGRRAESGYETGRLHRERQGRFGQSLYPRP